MPSTIAHQTELSANVVLLCRFLRKKGYKLSTLEESDALRAISFLPIHSEEYFKEALRSVLTKSQFQRTKFDEYYHEFKDQLKKASDSKVKELPEEKKQPEKKTKAAQFDALKDWLNLTPSDEQKEVAAFLSLIHI